MSERLVAVVVRDWATGRQRTATVPERELAAWSLRERVDVVRVVRGPGPAAEGPAERRERRPRQKRR